MLAGSQQQTFKSHRPTSREVPRICSSSSNRLLYCKPSVRRLLACSPVAAQPRTITPYPDSFPGLQPGDDLPEDYGEPQPNPPKNRRAGVILHPTSLPGKYGTGEIGQEAFNFVDWLAATGMQLWQMLPLVPPDKYWSPYSGLDALCGNPLLIPLDELVQMGLLKASELPPSQPVELTADFPAVYAQKTPLLEKAAHRLLNEPEHKQLRREMEEFRKQNPWVEESALFSVITEQPGTGDKNWWEWEPKHRDAHPETIAALKAASADRFDTFIAIQFLFDHFWKAVKAYANSKGVKLVGDMPIYVGGHSADVWANRHLFELGSDGQPSLVSGVPPDAFSATGQLWGSPLYDWKAHRKDGYRWWVQRFERTLQMYDETRVDHFRGFAGYWAVGAESETAMNGKWLKGPGIELFEALEQALGDVPILAEDLGVITRDVVQLSLGVRPAHCLRTGDTGTGNVRKALLCCAVLRREGIGAPGMVVLQFAWGGGPTNTHLPHNHYENCFVYPGTHDNQTAVGWWKKGATAFERNLIRRYTGMTGDDVAWAFIQESMKSVARTSVVTMQDIMRLDDSARMNTPGKAVGNWGWRVGESDIWAQLQEESEQLRKLLDISDRLLAQPPSLGEGAAEEAATAAVAGNGSHASSEREAAGEGTVLGRQ